jgi:hypothetical protein
MANFAYNLRQSRVTSQGVVGERAADQPRASKPGDIPIYQSAKFALVIDLKTAEGLTLLSRPRCSQPPTR